MHGCCRRGSRRVFGGRKLSLQLSHPGLQVVETYDRLLDDLQSSVSFGVIRHAQRPADLWGLAVVLEAFEGLLDVFFRYKLSGDDGGQKSP